VDNIKYRHPNLSGALEKTYGVSLYEEGMMTIAKDCAGWDLNQADALRKITKLKGKDPQLVLKTEASFIADCIKVSNMSYKDARSIWANEIEPFGDYGFNKSHSISYSHISYYTAWLRKHYPTEFMCALLNSEDPNSDKALEYINACSKMDINITPPNVNTSGGNYVVTGPSEIATGLAAVKGVGGKAIIEILELQPFKNIEDFFFRTNGRTVNKRVIQAMAKAGAFQSLKRTRKDLHDNYAKYRTKVNNEIKKEKTIDQILLPKYDEEWDRKAMLVAEREILGRTISGSLHEVFEGFFRKGSSIVTPLSKLSSCDIGSKVKVEVIINTKLKEFKIKRGRNIGKKFAKYLIEDAYGSTTELTVWAHDYERYSSALIDGVPIKAICKVDEYMDKRGLSLSILEGVLGKRI
jgi:DNA polymerase-3 subunit alpha